MGLHIMGKIYALLYRSHLISAERAIEPDRLGLMLVLIPFFVAFYEFQNFFLSFPALSLSSPRALVLFPSDTE